MSLEIRIAPHGCSEYDAAVGLRRAVLRAPLGLDFTPEQLNAEAVDTHFVAVDDDGLIGAVVMTPYSATTVKLRQMAVSPVAQGRGIGAALVPTTSVDQYAATMGAWFGVSSSDLATIFPNLGNFSRTNLGFV